MESAENRTIRDFGDQWSHYPSNEGYYGSVELLQDMLGPLLPVEALRGARVADIGSGTGRITRMLVEAGAEHVVAVEPSLAVEPLRENTRDIADRVEIIHAPGEALPSGRSFDFVVSIGVLQFIEDPQPLLRAALAGLRPGGQIVVWVYGKEGNEAYMLLLNALRSVTIHLPHAALSPLCSLLNFCLDVYMFACRFLPLPLRDHLTNTVARLSRDQRKLTIYDQLNPTFVKFYERAEVKRMLERSGFSDVALYHRRGYSWTAHGVKRAQEVQVRDRKNHGASTSDRVE